MACQADLNVQSENKNTILDDVNDADIEDDDEDEDDAEHDEEHNTDDINRIDIQDSGEPYYLPLALKNDVNSKLSHSIIDQFRQEIIVLLLRRVCEFVDATPKTFIQNCMKMYNLGILTSMSFLNTSDNKLANKVQFRPQFIEQDVALSLWRVLTSFALNIDPSSHSISSIPLSRFRTDFTEVVRINKGAFGQVFSAKHRLDGLRYAVKRIRFSHCGSSALFQQQVFTEVECLAQLHHRNICRYVSAWIEPAWKQPNIASQHSECSSIAISSCNQSQANSISTYNNSNVEDRNDNISHSQVCNCQDLHTVSFTHKPAESKESNSCDSSTLNKSLLNPLMSMASSSSNNQSCSGQNENNVTKLFEHVQKDTGQLAVPSSLSAESWHRQYKETVERSANIVFDVELFIQMELCSPFTLKDIIDDNQTPMTETNAIKLFIQIVKGLEHVHSKGILHRDLKPSNILLRARDNSSPQLLHCETIDWSTYDICIGDFGLSKLFQRHTRNESVSTDGENFSSELTCGLGTITYASPEQMNRRDYGPSTDIYSVGIILFEMLNRFSTQMERATTIEALRSREFIPVSFQNTFPNCSRLIKSMTCHLAEKRPSAQDILHDTFVLSCQDSHETKQKMQSSKIHKTCSIGINTDFQRSDRDTIIRQAHIITKQQRTIEHLKSLLSHAN